MTDPFSLSRSIQSYQTSKLPNGTSLMTARGFSHKMTAVILKSADINTISHEHASHSRVCAALESLSRQLLELTTVIQTLHLENPSADLENLTSELGWQLEHAKQLAQGLGTYPEVYRAMSAARIRAQCLHVCRSIGDSLENLTALLMTVERSDSFPGGYFERLRDLAFAFRHLEYPLQTQDIMIRQKTKDWASQVYNGQMRQLDGLIAIRDYLEQVIGKEKLQEEWSKVSTFFLHDIYNAHSRDDPEEEHYLRLLFWALNGVHTPPPEYLCPISLSIMQDPVVLCESEVTYERQNITTWMMEDDRKTCPVSQKKIRSVVLIENASLKAAIANWQREQSRNPEYDFSTTYPESDFGTIMTQTEGIQEKMDRWDSMPVPVETIEAAHGVRSSRLGTREMGSGSGLSPLVEHMNELTLGAKIGGSDNVSVGSSQANRMQKQIMTKEIASQMFEAASTGAVSILNEIREKGFDLMLFDEGGRNPLHLACIHGRPEVIHFLLEQRVSPNTPTKDDLSSPLILAASNGHARCVEVLLDHGADLVGQDKRGWTALHTACDLGHRSAIQSLVKSGELRNIRYLNMKTESGWTVLHNAARKGDLEVFRFLLRFRGCNINEPCKAGWTVLHIAVERGHKAIVSEILRFPGANINARSRDGWTALHSAVDSGDVEIGLMLVQGNINVNAASNNGYTALHRAAYYNKLDFGKMLVEQGKADLSLKTQTGRTAKEITSDRGYNDFHQYLFRQAIRTFFVPRRNN